MARPLREAWISTVEPGDYERHMAAIGQAQANAQHVGAFVDFCAPPRGERVLIAGAGTGQMFDYIEPSIFSGARAVFADINPRFLARLRTRFPAAACVADDLEQSSLRGPFHAACAVLVLEHIEWRKGLDTLAALLPRHLFLVIQQNPPEIPTAVTPARVLPGTMRVFAEARPVLLEPAAVIAHLQNAGYSLRMEAPRTVADGKTMLGLLFCVP